MLKEAFDLREYFLPQKWATSSALMLASVFGIDGMCSAVLLQFHCGHVHYSTSRKFAVD